MRHVDEIVRENALRFIEHAAAVAARDNLLVDESVIAGRMAAAMGMQKKSVAKQLHRYLHEGHVWRIDYVEALGAALGRSVAEFVMPQDAGGVEATAIAQSLYTALNHRLRPRQSRDLVRRLQRLLDHPPLYDLSQALLDVVLEAKSRDAARLEAHDVIAKSAAWDSKRRDLRGKRTGDKKS